MHKQKQDGGPDGSNIVYNPVCDLSDAPRQNTVKQGKRPQKDNQTSKGKRIPSHSFCLQPLESCFPQVLHFSTFVSSFTNHFLLPSSPATVCFSSTIHFLPPFSPVTYFSFQNLPLPPLSPVTSFPLPKLTSCLPSVL